MRKAAERCRELIEASVVAVNVAVPVEAQRQRDGEVRAHLPFILDIETEAVQAERLGADIRERLRIGGSVIERSVHEVGDGVERQQAAGIRPIGVGADPVLADVDAELEVVSSAQYGEVIDNLLLPYFPALRISIVAAAERVEQTVAEGEGGRERCQCGLRDLEVQTIAE